MSDGFSEHELPDTRHALPSRVEVMSLADARTAFGLMAQVDPQTVDSEAAFVQAYSQLPGALAAMGRHLIAYGAIFPTEYGKTSMWKAPGGSTRALRLDYTEAAQDLGRTARSAKSTFDSSGRVVDSHYAPDEPDSAAFTEAMFARITPSRVQVTKFPQENPGDLFNNFPVLALDWTFEPRMDHPSLVISRLKDPRPSISYLRASVGARSDNPREWTQHQIDMAKGVMTKTVALPSLPYREVHTGDYTFAAEGIKQTAMLLLDRDQEVTDHPSSLPAVPEE